MPQVQTIRAAAKNFEPHSCKQTDTLLIRNDSLITMDDLLHPIRQFAKTASDTERQKLASSLHNLAYSLETADETLHRYGSLVISNCVFPSSTE